MVCIKSHIHHILSPICDKSAKFREFGTLKWYYAAKEVYFQVSVAGTDRSLKLDTGPADHAGYKERLAGPFVTISS